MRAHNNLFFFSCHQQQRTCLIVKSLRSSRSFPSISSSSSCVRDLISPLSSILLANKLCRSVGMSCCFSKAWSSGWVMLSKLWPYKSDYWKNGADYFKIKLRNYSHYPKQSEALNCACLYLLRAERQGRAQLEWKIMARETRIVSQLQLCISI